MKRLIFIDIQLIEFLDDSSCKYIVQCAKERKSTKELVQDLNRVRSSNLYSMGFDVKDDRRGNLLIQFQNRFGSPGDIYIYYDVPINVYRRFVGASSKGHFFWRFIRNVYKYSKLTGSKRGVLPNAIN